MPLAALVLSAKGGWTAFEREQLGGGSPQGSGDINQVPWTSAGAQQRPPLRHAAQQNDVGNHQAAGMPQPRRRLGQIPTRQRDPVPLSQSHQPVEESLHPRLMRSLVVSGQFRRQSERKKGRLRASSHGCQVAQAARQAAMAYALRRMPIAAEMNIFEREVGGDDQLFSAPRPYHSAIVADAEMQDPALTRICPARLRMVAISSRSPVSSIDFFCARQPWRQHTLPVCRELAVMATW